MSENRKVAIEARISVTDAPEMLVLMRGELAQLLREAADDQDDPRVAGALRECAAIFEAGQSWEKD